MRKSDYFDKLKLDTKNHVNNITFLIKSLNFKIQKLMQSKMLTDGLCKKFGIECYSYNLVYEMNESKSRFIKNLEKLFKQIQLILNQKSRNIDYDIQRVKSINDLLTTYEIQLGTINKYDLSNVENLELNAIKKEIYEQYMRKRAYIDRDILYEKFSKIRNRNAVQKVLDQFLVRKEIVSRQSENLFITIRGIDDCIAGFRQGEEPNREYKIIDILAEVCIYLNENKNIRKKYKNQYYDLVQLKDKIQSTFSIDKTELKKVIADKYKSKYPMPADKNVNKMKIKYQKNIEFLYRNGYAKSYQEVTYKSKMNTLINKLKLLSDNVKREVNR